LPVDRRHELPALARARAEEAVDELEPAAAVREAAAF